MRLEWGTIANVVRAYDDLQLLDVQLDGGESGRAVNYPRLAGDCQAGDRVLLNTTAVQLALGTGGNHFVVARIGSARGVALDAPSGGHMMKLRYTPMQLDVVAVEAQESVHHEVMRSAISLEAMPVVCCGLHSHVPLVAAAIKHADPELTVAYCMTDHGALALPLSDVLRASVTAGLIDSTFTCGQAFGGEHEAINLHSGLLAARHVGRADVAIVALGPGVAGTATAFGHGGVAQGEAINAVAALGGVPVACLRVSFADVRDRHRGVSHHSLAALSQVALAPAKVPIPDLEPDFSNAIETALESAGVWIRHERMSAQAGSVPHPPLRGVEVRTMGRTIAEDPAFFAAAFAAGEIASTLVPPVLS